MVIVQRLEGRQIEIYFPGTALSVNDVEDDDSMFYDLAQAIQNVTIHYTTIHTKEGFTHEHIGYIYRTG